MPTGLHAALATLPAPVALALGSALAELRSEIDDLRSRVAPPPVKATRAAAIVLDLLRISVIVSTWIVAS